MELGLKGRHVAILAADGVDGAQIGGLRTAVTDTGAVAHVLGTRDGRVRATTSEGVVVDRRLEQCHAADYDALVIPGGKDGVDALRADRYAVQLVKEFMAADKPVAAVGAGVSLLAAADAVAGRAIAAEAEVADAIRRGGGEIVDALVKVDERLITARDQVDVRELSGLMVREFADRVDEAKVDQLSEQSFPASDPPPGPVAVGGEGASESEHLDPRRST